MYSDLGGKTNAWHLREIVRRLCEQRQKISTSADEQQDHAARRGRDAFGTATRISASLFRRLSAFSGRAPDQGLKAAKFAVLIPGPGMFVNVRNGPRVVTAPPSKTPPVSPCVPAFTHESERGAFVREVKKRDEKRLGIKFMAVVLPDFSLLLVLRVHSEPGNVCI